MHISWFLLQLHLSNFDKEIGIRLCYHDLAGGKEKRKKVTLFDLVFQLKFTTSEDVVKMFLSNYKNSYIGKLPEKEAQLIKLYLEV